MAISSITPVFTFISTGEKTMMYTLKQMCDVVAYIDGQRVSYRDSFYIQNLSTDKAQAKAKANDISVGAGLPFRDNVEFDLQEIRRRAAGVAKAEQEAREQALREYKERIAQEFQEEVGKGFMACGKYMGMTADQIVADGDVDYVIYCASQYTPEHTTYGAWIINCKVCAEWLSNNPQQESDYVGAVGSKIEEKVTVKRVAVCNGRFYTVMYLCVTPEGNLIKFFTTAKAFDDVKRGDEFVVMGSVKGQDKDVYLDGSPKVTMINRPKMVK